MDYCEIKGVDWPFNLDGRVWDTSALQREIDLDEEFMLNTTDEDSCFEVQQVNMILTALQHADRDPLWANSFVEKPSFENCFICEDEYDYLSSTMLNPRSGLLVQDQFGQSVPAEPIQPKEEPKPYHWTHDHDYTGKLAKELESVRENKIMDIKEEPQSESEQVVEVWEIESFSNEPQRADPGCGLKVQGAASRYEEISTRRQSLRTAQLKQKMQDRKLSNAIRAGLKNEKAKKIRQYKNIQPKNSVETTPSQSDIEEWTSQPVRPTYTRITKKKTSKGRIDHSESERHRREVLREKFAALSKVVPSRFLRGEKPSSQISKQKILNGAKAFIAAQTSSKCSYKTRFHENVELRERWQSICNKKK